MSLWEIHGRDSDFKSIFFRSDRWLKVLNFLYSEGQQTLISISAELSASYGLISSIHPILILISSLWSDGRLFFRNNEPSDELVFVPAGHFWTIVVWEHWTVRTVE